MIYGSHAPQYDVTLEPKRKIQLPGTNICIKHDNEETLFGGPYETTKIWRMISKSVREPITKRKQKLKLQLLLEETQWSKEFQAKSCQRESQLEEEVEIDQLKRKLQDMCQQFWNSQAEHKRELLKKQEDLRRLNLLNATKSRDLDALIRSRSVEYKKNCTEANINLLYDKRNMKQNVMLWETQYLDKVLFPDNLEAKVKECRQQIHDFIVANRNLIEVKRKEREEERKRDEAYYKSKLEECAREQREEDQKREQEKLVVLQQRQAHMDYFNYRKREREDCEKREKEKELQQARDSRAEEIERDKARRKKEKEDKLEEFRQFLFMKQKYDEDMRKREKELLDLIERESQSRAAAKLKQEAEWDRIRRSQERETFLTLEQQIAERQHHRRQIEENKMAEIEFWKVEREKIKMEVEKEKFDKLLERDKFLVNLKSQIDFNEHRKQC